VSRGEVQTIEVPIGGMCCADEAQEVQRAISALPGVASVDVLLASERAIIRYDPAWVGLPAVERAVEGVGCSVPAAAAAHPEPPHVRGFGRAVLSMFGAVIGVVLFVVVGGEWLGLYETITDQVPWPVWLSVLLAGGYPVFRGVLRAALKRKVTAHTLMTVGVVAAVVVGEWPVAVVVVLAQRGEPFGVDPCHDPPPRSRR